MSRPAPEAARLERVEQECAEIRRRLREFSESLAVLGTAEDRKMRLEWEEERGRLLAEVARSMQSVLAQLESFRWLTEQVRELTDQRFDHATETLKAVHARLSALESRLFARRSPSGEVSLARLDSAQQAARQTSETLRSAASERPKATPDPAATTGQHITVNVAAPAHPASSRPSRRETPKRWWQDDQARTAAITTVGAVVIWIVWMLIRMMDPGLPPPPLPAPSASPSR
jgi:hypothetical protein